MNRLVISVLFTMMIAVIFGCSPDKQRGVEDVGGSNHKAKFDAYGINYADDNVGRDKGPVAMFYRSYLEKREPQLLDHLERQTCRVRGIEDVKIISFKDNIIIGVKTSGTPQPDTINPEADVPSTPPQPLQIFNGKTDAIQQRVISEVRSRLQNETRYNTLFVTTNPILFHRISELKQHSIHAQQVDENVYKVLLNEIGYTTKVINLN